MRRCVANSAYIFTWRKDFRIQLLVEIRKDELPAHLQNLQLTEGLSLTKRRDIGTDNMVAVVAAAQLLLSAGQPVSGHIEVKRPKKIEHTEIECILSTNNWIASLCTSLPALTFPSFAFSISSWSNSTRSKT